MKKRQPAKKDVDNKNKVDVDILRELAVSLKSIDDSKEESELEEDVGLNIKDFEFRDFMLSSGGSSAPVLERIAGSQPGPIFVGGFSQSSNTIPGEEKESDPFKYVPGQNANGEPKYIDSDSHIGTAIERVDFNRLGRTGFQPEINQETMFMQSAEAKFESQFQEKVWAAERFDADREKRKNLLERDEAKYDKYKPDLPKSR